MRASTPNSSTVPCKKGGISPRDIANPVYFLEKGEKWSSGSVSGLQGSRELQQKKATHRLAPANLKNKNRGKRQNVGVFTGGIYSEQHKGSKREGG